MLSDNELSAGRERLDVFLASADPTTTGGRMALSGAVFQARFLSDHGNVDDTRRLASVLTMVVTAAAAQRDELRTNATAGELLAVLSDVADNGDEDMAIAINSVVGDLNEHIIGFGRAWSRKRRAANCQ